MYCLIIILFISIILALQWKFDANKLRNKLQDKNPGPTEWIFGDLIWHTYDDSTKTIKLKEVPDPNPGSYKVGDVLKSATTPNHLSPVILGTKSAESTTHHKWSKGIPVNGFHTLSLGEAFINGEF